MRTKVKAFLFTLAIFACFSGAANAQPKAMDTTLAGAWFLMPALASDMVTGKSPTLQFDLVNKSFSGNTGCNTMRGMFLYSADSIRFSPDIVTTKMACTGYNEDAFLKNLIRTNSYKVRRGILIFFVDGQQISSWSRKPPKIGKTSRA